MSEKLVGIMSRSKLNQRLLKVHINVSALNDCKTYTTSDGQEFVALTLTALAVQKVIQDGDITTVVNMEGDDGQ